MNEFEKLQEEIRNHPNLSKEVATYALRSIGALVARVKKLEKELEHYRQKETSDET